MNLGALIGVIQDTRERRTFLAKLAHQKVGFRETPEGAWLWQFSLDELEDQHSAPTGPAVNLSRLMGLPFSRLRVAVPDEMVSWSTGTALGRIAALSMKELRDVHKHERFVKLSRRLGKHVGATSEADVEKSIRLARRAAAQAAAIAKQAAAMDEFIGTAMVLGFLQAEMLMPDVSLLRQPCQERNSRRERLRSRDWPF